MAKSCVGSVYARHLHADGHTVHRVVHVCVLGAAQPAADGLHEPGVWGVSRRHVLSLPLGHRGTVMSVRELGK